MGVTTLKTTVKGCSMGCFWLDSQQTLGSREEVWINVL